MIAIRSVGRRPPGKLLAAWAATPLLVAGGLALAGGTQQALADGTAPSCADGTCTVTFATPGTGQSFTVPAGVSSLSVTLYGGQGGENQAGDVIGGDGAEVTADLAVSPGAALGVDVGGVGAGGPGTYSAQGGINGGGSAANGGAGGGATDVTAGGTQLLVAGGGGGGGSDGGYTPTHTCFTESFVSGGGAGGNADTAGAPGQSVTIEGLTMNAGNGGAPGTAAGPGAGGAAGDDSGSSPCGGILAPGNDGSTGTGGTGGSFNEDQNSAGGGGGGGYLGGGQGGGGADLVGLDGIYSTGAGGGGGGMSYVAGAGVSDAVVTDAGNSGQVNGGNGDVVLSYQELPPAFTPDTPPLSAGAGTAYSYQFAASGTPAASFALGAGAPSWLSVDSSTGEVSGTPPAGTKSFSYSVTAANEAGSVTAGPFTVAVSAKADVSAGLSCPASLAVGIAGTCTLTVTNAGPALAATTVAGIAVPAQLTVTGCSADCTEKHTILGVGLGWTLGSLPAGQSDSLTVSVTGAHPGTALVAAADSSASPDPNLLNNVAAATVKVAR